MAKQRSLNELRQEKNYGYKAPLTPEQGYKSWANNSIEEQKIREGEIDLGYTEIDIDTTKELIIKELSNEMYDSIFQAVCDEMEKHEVFQTETYFTDQGFEEFQDTWYEFYHEHHGDILGAIMKSFTN